MKSEAVVFVHLVFLDESKNEKHKRMMGIGVPIPCSIWHVAEISMLHVRQEPSQYSVYTIHLFNDITREFELVEIPLVDVRVYPSVKFRIEVFPTHINTISLFKKDYERRFPDGRLELAAPEIVAGNSNPGNLCTICSDNPPDAVLVPCGHMGLCMTCGERLRNDNTGCAICRQSIREVIRAYNVN